MGTKGYTLLEALVGVMLMCVLISILLYFLIVLKTNLQDDYSKKEITILMSQIQNDFLNSKNLEVVDNVVFLTDYEDKTVTYSQHNEKLVRKVNNEGYEIMLNNIENIEFDEENNTLKAKIYFNDQNIYEGYIGAI